MATLTGKPSVRLIEDFKPCLVADIKAHGMWRCGVICPNCQGIPVAELKVGEIRRLFCRKHLKEFCMKYGVAVPSLPADNN